MNIRLVKRRIVPWVGLGLALYSGIFLLVFQPFGKIMHNGDPVLIIAILGYGFVASLVYFLFEYFLRPIVFTILNPDLLHIKLMWYLFIVLGVGVANHAFKIALGSSLSWIDLGGTIYRTATLSIFPFLALIIASSLRHGRSSQVKIRLLSENGRDHLNLNSEELLYVKSQDNYSSIVIEKDGICKRILLRGSLTFFENQIQDNSIVRCQRSFLVNLNRVVKFSYNSKVGTLELGGVLEVIPVSKKYLAHIKTRKLELNEA